MPSRGREPARGGPVSVPLRAAVFLDRDGVLVAERGLEAAGDPLELLPGVAEALRGLQSAGYARFVATNQAVVARGLITEERLAEQHAELERRIVRLGGPSFTAVLTCPHHPHADVPRYRVECLCRKPRPGMLREAAQRFRVDLHRSWMVGDRASDVAAGRRAGCRTVLIRGPASAAPPIVGAEGLGADGVPDYVCATLEEASERIQGVT